MHEKKELSHSVLFLYWQLDKISYYLFQFCFTVLEFTICSDILILDLSPFINTFCIWLFWVVICKVYPDSTERKQPGICWLSLNVGLCVQTLVQKSTQCQGELCQNNLKFIYVKPTFRWIDTDIKYFSCHRDMKYFIYYRDVDFYFIKQEWCCCII